MSKRQENLKRLLKPRHIAFVGGNNLVDAIRSTESIGFKGEIWIVNPRYDEIASRRCYKSIADLPEAPDATFLAVRNEFAIEAIRELAAVGAGGAVCYAAGFSEVGGKGKVLQQQLIEAAGDLAVVGPNCYGVLNYLDGAALWPDRHGGGAVERGVAIVSQSGNVALNMTMSERSVPLAYVISVGNQAVLGVGDYIEALIEDTRVAAVGLYLEGLNNVAGFSRAAVKALEKGIPIVVFKAGTSEIGTQLTMSHTSSLAGSDELYQALFDRLGVIRVESITHLLETLKLMAVSGPASGPRLGVLTCSGGDSAITADLSDAAGLTLNKLNEAQVASLREQLPDFATISNPLDYNTSIWGNLAALELCFTTMMADETFDTTLLVLDYPRPGVGDSWPWEAAVDAMIAAHQKSGRMAAVASILPELLPQAARERLAANGVAPLQGIWRALKGLGDSARYSQYRRQVIEDGRLASLALPEPAPATGGARMLDEWDSKQQLAAFGLTVPEGRLASAADAAGAAVEVGFPVVVKAVSDQLAHKTEAGAVRLNLKTPEDVEQAIAEIAANVADIPGVGDRFLVERMMAGAVAELIVGLKRDDQFGLAVVVGSGGILVELIKDSATVLLPTARDDVAKALDSLKGAKLLAGFRGRPEGDREAVIDAVMAVAAFADEHRDRVLELDVNPLLVLPRGQGAYAADALIRVGGE